MKTIIEYLFNVLNEELKCMDEAKRVLKEKEKALVKNDIDALEKIVMREREIFIAMRDMEESRKSVIELFLSKQGIEKENVNLFEIADLVGGDWKKRILDLRKKLRIKVIEINRINKKCALLLKKSIELADFSIKLLTGAYGEKTFYDKKGKKLENKQGKRLVVDYNA